MIKNTHSITVVVRPSQSQSIFEEHVFSKSSRNHGCGCHHGRHQSGHQSRHSCRDEHGGRQDRCASDRVEVSLFLSLLSFASPQSIQPEHVVRKHVVVTVVTVNIQIQCLHFRVWFPWRSLKQLQLPYHSWVISAGLVTWKTWKILKANRVAGKALQPGPCPQIAPHQRRHRLGVESKDQRHHFMILHDTYRPFKRTGGSCPQKGAIHFCWSPIMWIPFFICLPTLKQLLYLMNLHNQSGHQNPKMSHPQ